MNIFRHEFRTNAKSVVTWSLSLAVLIFVILSLYSSIAGDAEMLNDVLQDFPRELRVAFGMDRIDLSSVLGFYGLAFLLCQICLAIQAANYGFSILSAEERELTADFLLSKPVRRATILTSKLLSAVSGLAITNVVVWTSSLVGINVFRGGRPFDSRALLLLLASTIVFQLFFLTVGMLISLLVRRVRSVTSFSMALAFGMYVLSTFSGMLGEDKLEIITPFKHFDPNYIISNAAYDVPLVLISVTCIVVSVVGSYLLYTRRDIPAAV